MRFEAIGPDGKVKFNTCYLECIEKDTIDRRARAGYKFRLDGKLISPANLKSLIHQSSSNNLTQCTSSEYTTANDSVKRSVKSIKCLNNNKVYKNMSEAGRDLGIDSALISYSLKVGRPTKGYSFEFVE